MLPQGAEQPRQTGGNGSAPSGKLWTLESLWLQGPTAGCGLQKSGRNVDISAQFSVIPSLRFGVFPTVVSLNERN